MTHNSVNVEVAGWHRKVLAAAAVFIVLLVAMGGVLCVTQSIRACPDWPGCFGKLFPPLETSPIVEFTHRFLAFISAGLILVAAIAGLVRARRQPWILFPPLVAIVLLIAASYFGAEVVLHGITPVESVVDVGSALLATALIVAAAVIAQTLADRPGLAVRLSFRTPQDWLVLATVCLVYVIFASGVLVAGKNSITGCVGWPVYSPQVFQEDSLGAGNLLRLVLSVIGIFMIASMLVQTWRRRMKRPEVFRTARWVMGFFLLEAILQILLLIFGFKVAILIPYTVTGAFFWGALVALAVRVGLEKTDD